MSTTVFQNLETSSSLCHAKAPHAKDEPSLISSVVTSIQSNSAALLSINQAIHSNPEIAYEEYFAHDTITSHLELLGFSVTKKAYGLDTSFEAEIGSGGRLVIICAEYDALPGIGHACGHNLIATSSIATFIAAATAIKQHGISGRLRLLGTPAEEAGGGKAQLIRAGAFPEETAAAIMAHPMSAAALSDHDEFSGLAGLKLIAAHKFHVEFRGKPAHAGGEPWNGVNALDAAVAAYTNVGLLRQQMQPDERVHCVIEEGGTVPNIITSYTRMNWNVRSPTIGKADKLLERVKACIEAAALSTGCTVDFIESPSYFDLRVNDALCETYSRDMEMFGENVMIHQEKFVTASTDMGNVSHVVPSFHGAFVIPSPTDVSMHNPRFAACAGTEEAHNAALRCAKGMAMLAIHVLVDDDFAGRVRIDFAKGQQLDH